MTTKFTSTANKDGSHTLYVNGKKAIRGSLARRVDDLKVAGLCFEAGALARTQGDTRTYGCHFGMRSTRDRSVADFNRGWDSI